MVLHSKDEGNLVSPSSTLSSGPALRPGSAALTSDDPFWRREFGQARSPLSQAKFRPNTVFVIMAFKGKEMQNVYAAINDESRRLRLKASRVDNTPGSGLIIKSIVESIEAAEFIVCDLSHERPNVYYELGYAHGVGNHGTNILLIARKGTTLHFDVAPLQVNYYHSPKTLRATVGSGLLKMMLATRRIVTVDPAVPQGPSAAARLLRGESPPATSASRSPSQAARAKQDKTKRKSPEKKRK